MARRLDHSLSGSSTLSYIDMISGGFAAAFFLFLIFVSFPIETASTPSSGSRFLDVWVEWQDKDVHANLIVTHTPEAIEGVLATPVVIALNSQTLSRSSTNGQVSYSGRAQPFWTGLSEAGYGLSGDAVLKRVSDEGEWVGIWMRFSDPCPGAYRLSVAGHGVSADRLLQILESGSAPGPVAGRARVIVADGSEVIRYPDDGSQGVEVTFSTGLYASAADIPFDETITIEVGPSTAQSSLGHCETP